LAQSKVGPNFLLSGSQQKVERAKVPRKLRIFLYRTSRRKKFY
jgi:hypothetical protein